MQVSISPQQASNNKALRHKGNHHPAPLPQKAGRRDRWLLLAWLARGRVKLDYVERGLILPR